MICAPTYDAIENHKSEIRNIHMSRNTKIILIVVGALVIICLGLCGIGYFALNRLGNQLASNDPANAQHVAQQIADYTLPPGYRELMGIDLFVYKMAVIAPQVERDGMVFMLLGTNVAGVDQAQMERQMQQSFQQQYGKAGSTMQVVGQENVTIRGQDVTLTISESVGQDSRLRQALGTFEGKNGLVIVMVMGDADNWDDTLMRQFLSSIQ